MSTDDIAPLLAAGLNRKETLGLRQGVVTAWDPSTGNNTVLIAGQPFNDLPVIASGGLTLAVGDIVAVLRYQHTFLIFGTIRNAGTGSLATRSAKIATDGQRASTTFGDLAAFDQGAPGVGPVVTAYIGKARQALVFLSATASSSAGEYAQMSVAVTGASNIPVDPVNINYFGAKTSDVQGSPMAAIQFTAADGLNEGLNTFTAKYASFAGGNCFWRNRLVIVVPY